jgi:dTDP-4-amino-4,6-dideoxygalactose transaminase
MAISPQNVSSSLLSISAEGTQRRLQNLEQQILHLVEQIINNPAGKYVLRLVPFQPVYRTTNLPHRVASVVVARDVVSRLLCLPNYPELDQDELAYIITTMRRYYGCEGVSWEE